MNNENIIVQIRNLSKHFGKIQALKDITLDISRGQIIGLLGANGCGKSTLLRHIIGLYLADGGTCETFGTDAAKLSPVELGKIGYVHQEGELLGWMTVKQLIRYVSAYYKNWNHHLEEKYISDFNIPLTKRVASLSPGQRQQLAILLAIGFDPELLILDEPASALDPLARSRFLDLLLQLIQSGDRTIIISSHILSDVEKVIDHTLIMKQGEIIRDCSFDSLREEFLKFTITSLNGSLPKNLPFKNIIQCEQNDNKAVMIVQNETEDNLRNIAKNLNCEIEIKTLPLDDLYKIVVCG
ncbi:MAG: ABC transporter ATP-binding protein [Phycisphaerales bacterium]